MVGGSNFTFSGNLSINKKKLLLGGDCFCGLPIFLDIYWDVSVLFHTDQVHFLV